MANHILDAKLFGNQFEVKERIGNLLRTEMPRGAKRFSTSPRALTK